jgi:CIC family chloride channel protein
VKIPTLKEKTPSLLASNEYTIMTILAIVVGLIGGFGAVGFRYLLNIVQAMAYGSKGNLIELAASIPWYHKIFIPSVGGLIVGPLVYFFAREAKGHGVPEVMEAVALKSGLMRKRVVFIKTLASAVSIGTGGSVGREGPIVQIGSAIGSVIGQLFKVSGDRVRTLVGCGAAAGIAATFNAPIAGSMFALEIVLGDFGLATFSPIVISSVTSTAISRYFLGDFPAFIVPQYQLISAWELPLYALMGFLCAFIAIFFTKTLYFSEDLFDKLKIPDYLKACFGGLLLGCMAVQYPHILGVGYFAMDMALTQHLTLWTLLILVVVKILATSITIGSGGSGGIFAPSLFLGCMAGGFFGSVAHALFPLLTASPGAYSIVGMAAVVSGTTRGPLSAILILFEMTGEYKIILPLMIACIISTLASGWLMRESIYTLKLARRGINIRAGKEVNILKAIPVKDVMSSHVETVSEDFSLGVLAEKISKSKNNSFPVLDKKGKLTGILSFIDYRDVIFEDDLKDLIIAKDLATTDVVTIPDDDNLYTALQKISQKDFSTLPVVSPQNPSQLVGIISRRDILGAYNKAVIKKSVLHS